MSKVDKALEVGSSFDWITPMFSLFMSRRGYDTYRVPADYVSMVQGAAVVARVKLRNEQVVKGDYLFDLKQREWARLCYVLGW